MRAKDLGHIRRAAEKLTFGRSGVSRWGVLPGRPGSFGRRGVHDDDRASGVMGNLVGNAAEQELGAITHADVADHHEVDPLMLAGPHYGIRRVGVVHH